MYCLSEQLLAESALHVCAENPLECWVFEMVASLNKHTKTAVSDAWRTFKGALGLDTSRKVTDTKPTSHCGQLPYCAACTCPHTPVHACDLPCTC